VIASIEQAIKQRLSDGLGQMVSGVHTYGGEFDGEGLAQVVNQFPAVWVMFAGITDSEPHDTRRTRYQVTGHFTVLVGDRASGSEADSRFGGLHRNDVGTYRLMQAVRLLLINQTMGLCIGRLKPGKAKSLFSKQMELDAISVFALDFETHWFEDALRDGDWPRPTVSDAQQAQIYADVSEYHGCTYPEHPDADPNTLERPPPTKHPTPPADMAATVKTEVKHD